MRSGTGIRYRIIAILFISFLTVAGAVTLLASSGVLPGAGGRGGTAEAGATGRTGGRDAATALKAFTAAVDRKLAVSIAGRYSWIELNGLTHRLLGQRCVEDDEADVYRLSDGSLSYVTPRMSDESLEGFASSTAALKARIGDTPLLYVQIPYKVTDGIETPAGVTDYGDDNADRLLGFMEKEGIDTLDLRDEPGLRNSPAAGSVQAPDGNAAAADDADAAVFYRTDQHWRSSASFRAAGCVCRTASERWGWTYDGGAFSLDNTDTEIYGGQFLGAFGRKTGRLYAGTDDFDLLIPRGGEDYTFDAVTASGDIHREGSFSDAFLDKENLGGDLYNTNTYETYSGGNYGIAKTGCGSAQNGRRVLLIRDSFSCNMLPFMAPWAEEICSVDLRNAEEGTLDRLLSEEWDAVIIAYNPSVFGKKCFSFE